MGIFEGILIVSDIDGTFLGANSRIVPENLEAIEYFKHNGGKFTFATGRVWRNLLRAVPNAMSICNAPIICCNGAYMYLADKNKIINTHPANPEGFARIAEFVAQRHPDVGARVCTDYGYISDGRTELIRRDLAGFPDEISRVLPVGDWEVLDGEEWYKIVFRGDADSLTRAREDIEAEFGDAYEYANSSPVFFEINEKGCTKAAATADLRRMCRDGCDRETFMYCCGDYENDLAMLNAADVAVCPENARDYVKKACKYTLCDHDKGIFAELIPIIEDELKSKDYKNGTLDKSAK